MTLWIGKGAVLKSSSEWQLKGFGELNNSGHELFIFKIILIAIDWNFLRTTILPIHKAPARVAQW